MLQNLIVVRNASIDENGDNLPCIVCVNGKNFLVYPVFIDDYAGLGDITVADFHLFRGACYILSSSVTNSLDYTFHNVQKLVEDNNPVTLVLQSDKISYLLRPLTDSDRVYGTIEFTEIGSD